MADKEEKPKDIVNFTVLTLGVLFLLWYLGGGPEKYAESQKQATGTSSPSSFFSFLPIIPQLPVPNISSDFEAGGSYSGGIYESGSYYSPTPYTLEAGSAGSGSASNEYLILKIGGQGQQVITGLELRSQVTGRGAILQDGVYLPFANQVNEKQAIFAHPGDTVYINSGRSPTGYSFRVNKCSGYFEQFQNFSPSISLQCPTLKEEKLLPKPPNALSDACVYYVESLSRCQVATSPGTNDLPQECLNFLSENANYTKCVERHKDDADFYKNEWRVFLNYSDPLWKNSRESIKLVSPSGETLSSVSY